MIIRSQDKKVICDFGAGCSIAMMGEQDDGFLIGIGVGQDDYDFGYYGTEDEAMRVVGSIYAALRAGAEFYDMPEAREIITLDALYKNGELSTRNLNALKRAGFTNLDEVIAAGDKKLMKIRNFGQSGLNEIHDVIQKYQEGKDNVH